MTDTARLGVKKHNKLDSYMNLRIIIIANDNYSRYYARDFTDLVYYYYRGLL